MESKTGNIFFERISVFGNESFFSEYATGFRFGFNGKLKDDELYGTGNAYDYGMRMYDARLGRFLSVDPLFKKYPELSTYQFASNSPIQANDLDGLEAHGADNYSTYKMLSTAGYNTEEIVQFNKDQRRENAKALIVSLKYSGLIAAIVSGNEYALVLAPTSLGLSFGKDVTIAVDPNNKNVAHTPDTFTGVLVKAAFTYAGYNPDLGGKTGDFIESSAFAIEDVADIYKNKNVNALSFVATISDLKSTYSTTKDLFSSSVSAYAPQSMQPTAPKESTLSNYTIKQGDTLFGIAKAYNTTVSAIAKENGIANPDKINAGQNIRITKK